MKEFLKISIVQADLFWLDKKKNIKLFNALIEKVDETDIVLLPEMFNTSFCPSEIKMAEAMNGDTVSWMRQLASEKKCSVVGSLMIKENNNIYRLFWILLFKLVVELTFYFKNHSIMKKLFILTILTLSITSAKASELLITNASGSLNKNEGEVASDATSWPSGNQVDGFPLVLCTGTRAQ